MILYIHGFASCGLGEKSRLLTRHFGRGRVLTPDLSHEPAVAVRQLEDLRQRHPVELLVGASLGGHYATWLNRRRPTPAVLINPAVNPARLLGAHVGRNTRWCDGRPFDLLPGHIRDLAAQYRPRPGPDESYLVLLQTGDTTLDYRVAAQYYAAFQVLVGAGGSHRFDNLADYLPAITAFLEARRSTAT